MEHSYIHIFKQLDKFVSSFPRLSTLEELIKSIDEILEEMLHVKHMGLYLYDSESNTLKLQYSKGFTNAEKIFAEETAMQRHPGIVYSSGQLIYIPDAAKDPSIDAENDALLQNVRSRLYLPVMNREVVVGAFGITDPEPNRYNEEDIALLSFICNMAGVLYGNIHNQNLLKIANEDIQDFSKLAAESPNPVMRISFSNKLMFANKASQQLLDHLKIRVGETIEPVLIDGLEEAMIQKKQLEKEISIEKVTYSFIFAPVNDSGYINLYGRDITKRKLLENELKRLAVIAKETENSVILSNNQGKIEWVNEAFTNITEYTPEEVLGRKPAEFLVGPETDITIVTKIAAAMKNQKALEVDVINYTKSKKKYWIKLQLQPVFNADGYLENYISIQKVITKEKAIEQKLIETTNFQKAILNSSAIAIISTNLNGVIQSFNQAAIRMFGYDADELIGIKTPAILHDRNEILNRYQQKPDQNICYFGICELSVSMDIHSIQTEVFEYSCFHKNGGKIPVSLTITALRDEHDEVTGYLGMAKDITDRQIQYEALKIANLRFRSLITSMQSGVMVEDEERRIVLVNQHFCNLFSIPLHPDQLIGAACEPAAEASKMLFAHPEKFVQDINNTLALSQVVTNFELLMVNGTALERDFIPLVDQEEKNHGILWIYRDITARKNNERDLLRQSQILSGTAQAMNYLLTLHDHDQAIQKVLETIGIATGVDRVYIFENKEDEKTGEAYFSQQFEWTAEGIVPQIDNQELQNMPYSENFPGWYNTLKSGNIVSGLSTNFPDNERLILEEQDIKSIIAAPIFVEDRLWGMVGFDNCTAGIDWSTNELSIIRVLAGSLGGSISKRIIEKELTSARHIAEYATKTKSEFLATMSHEIRTPMNGVIGMTSLLMQTQLSADQRDYAETIRVSGELLLDVINDILDFSKIESGKMILEEHHLNLRLAIEDVLDLMATSTFEKKLGLYFQVDPSIPRRITGDLTRLRQILVNLAGNAVKFTSSGEVIISVRQVEKHGDDAVLEFCVKDTGVGIPDEKIGLLFKPFSQVDASTTRKFGGTGLGLAICAKLIGLMHGKIWVKSQVGIGTEFYFTIQTSYQHEEEISSGSSDQEIMKDKKVLIVDGNPTSGKVLCSLLANLGLIPVWKQTISSALSEFESVPAFDLVLIDNDFPENENTLLVSEIRKKTENSILPLILIAQPVITDFASNTDLKFEAKINKPLKHSQLISTVRNLLSKTTQPKSQNMNQPKPVQKINDLYPLNILVAEDNAINQKLIARLFEMLGYSIHIAANGFEVLDALKRMKIDIVFMDIQMPEMDGIEATRQIIEQWKDKKPMIVAMTANALYTDKEKCLAAGMDDYISKPLTIIQVRAGIERWAKTCNLTIQENFDLHID